MTDANNAPEDDGSGSLVMSSKTYDALRFVAIILLPALGALYFGLAQIWGLPKTEEVVGTITVVDTFLGIFVRAARKSYENSGERFAGEIHVEHNDEEGTSSLRLLADGHKIVNNDEVTLKVKQRDV